MRRYLKILICVILCSCSVEKDNIVSPSAESVHYSVTVSSTDATKYSLNGNNEYIFEAGDRLYVINGEDMWGYLDLISGDGTTTAVFTGDLVLEEGFVPTASTPISFYLIGASDEVHSISDRATVSTPVYDGDEVAESFSEAIQKFSHFTTSGLFGDQNFTLRQQSAFIQFTLTLNRTDFPSDVTIKLKKGQEVLRSIPITPGESNATAVRARFTMAFPGGTDMFAGETHIVVEDNDSSVSLDPMTNNVDFTLAANKYYTLKRTVFSWNGFSVKARDNGTKVSMKFGTDSGGGEVQYSIDQGGFWENYDANTLIDLNAGDKVCFCAKRTTYNNYDAGSAIISSVDNKLCYVCGNIMSLISNSDWSFETITSVGTDVFNCAFSNSTGGGADNYTPNTHIATDPSDMLILPATTLGEKCYKGMFKGCQSLTTAPVLPAPSPAANQVYMAMFAHCRNLSYVKCLSDSGTNPGSTRRYSDWLKDVSPTGTFVRKASGANGIPNGWTEVTE